MSLLTVRVPLDLISSVWLSQVESRAGEADRGWCAAALHPRDRARRLGHAVERARVGEEVHGAAEEGVDAVSPQEHLDLRRIAVVGPDPAAEIRRRRRRRSRVAGALAAHGRAAVVGRAVRVRRRGHDRGCVPLADVVRRRKGARIRGVLQVPSLVERMRPVDDEEHQREEHRNQEKEQDERLPALVLNAPPTPPRRAVRLHDPYGAVYPGQFPAGEIE